MRDGLDQFAHIHPEVDPSGNITATFTFATAGTYRLYADHKPVGRTQATLMAEVNVAGTPPPRPKLVPDAPGRVAVAGVTVDIAIATANAAGTTRITFTLLAGAGKPVADLQPYLGAMGHLVIISADGRQFVHAHPRQEVAADGVVSFDAHFPHPGIYKGWGQFRRPTANAARPPAPPPAPPRRRPPRPSTAPRCSPRDRSGTSPAPPSRGRSTRRASRRCPRTPDTVYRVSP